MEKINDYSAILEMDIETYQCNEQLLNRFVKPETLLKSVSISNIRKYVDREIIDLTEDELNEICHDEKEITFVEKESQGFSKTFRNKNGFTVREMFDNVADFEKETRPLSIWFGGIDAHHIHFEGLYKISGSENHYSISWGS